MESLEIIKELESLREQINTIDSNLKFNINIFMTMLALSIALAGGALVLLVRSIVDKRVTEELERTIKANPPILHLKGKAEKVWERLNNHEFHSCLYIGIDTKNLDLESLEFPVELQVYKKREITLPSVELDGSLTEFEGETKTPITPLYTEVREDYIMVIIEETDKHRISDDYYWSLKMPNPKFSKKG